MAVVNISCVANFCARKIGFCFILLLLCGYCRWGGCTISLVPSDKVDTFLKEVGAKFYGKFGDSVARDTAMFVTKPGSGAAVFVP